MLRKVRAALTPDVDGERLPDGWERADEYPYGHLADAADEARRALREDERPDRAEALLEWCVAYVEHESRSEYFLDVPPAYYEELADLYRAAGRYEAEVAVLRRYVATVREVGGAPRDRMLERLEAARARLA
jgi:hypothetical protein